METKIVTRHDGALEWVKKHHPEFADVEVIAQASPEDLKGNRIIGTLPIHLAAICKRYWHLEMTVPADRRGTEISCEDMEKFGCKITRFEVIKISGIDSDKRECPFMGQGAYYPSCYLLVDDDPDK